MSHYDNPLVMSYNFGAHDFAATAGAWAIKQPQDLNRCRILEIHVAVTEVFNEVTTAAFVRIGTSGDADRFAELDMGGAALTDGWGLRDAYDAGDSPLKDTAGYGLGIIDLVEDSIDQLEVATVKNTGGTPTGKGFLTVVLGWW